VAVFGEGCEVIHHEVVLHFGRAFDGVFEAW